MYSVLRYAEGKWQIAFSSRSANLRGWPGHDSVVWIQDGNRIVYMAGGRTHTVEKLSALAGVVLAIRPEDDGAFWVGTSQGAARFGPPLWQAPAELEQIGGARVFDLGGFFHNQSPFPCRRAQSGSKARVARPIWLMSIP